MIDTQQPTDPRYRAITVAVIGPKGGTGKTFFLLNAAHIITDLKPEGYQRGRVLIIDADSATHGASGFLNPAYTDSSGRHRSNAIADRFEEWSKEKEGSIPLEEEDLPRPLECHIPGGAQVDLLFARAEYEPPPAEIPKPDQARYQVYFKKTLEHYRPKYDYILIDNPGGAGFTASLSAAEADQIIVVMEPAAISQNLLLPLLRDLHQALNALCDEHSKKNNRKLNIVLNKSDMDDNTTFIDDKKKDFRFLSMSGLRLLYDNSGQAQKIKYCSDAKFFNKASALPTVGLPYSDYSSSFVEALYNTLIKYGPSDWDKRKLPRLKGAHQAELKKRVANVKRGWLYRCSEWLFRHWHWLYFWSFLVFAGGAFAIKHYAIQFWEWPFYVLVFVSLVFPAIVSGLALGYANWRRITTKRPRIGEQESHYVSGGIVAGLLMVLAGLAFFASSKLLISPDQFMDHNQLIDDHDLLKADYEHVKAERDVLLWSENEIAKHADKVAEQAKRAAEQAERSEDSLVTIEKKHASLTDAHRDLEGAAAVLWLLIAEQVGRIGSLEYEREIYYWLTRDDLLRLEGALEQFESFKTASESDPEDRGRMRRALAAARGYISEISRRDLSHRDYPEVYVDYIVAINGNDKADSGVKTKWRSQLRELGQKAFQNQDLGWATRLLTEWLSLEIKADPQIPPSDDAYLQLIACLAATGGEDALDDLPEKVQSFIAEQDKKSPVRFIVEEEPEIGNLLITATNGLLPHEKRWFMDTVGCSDCTSSPGRPMP